jgi:hypothetical protein
MDQPADNALYLRYWARNIREHSGSSVDADRLDAIAGEVERLREALQFIAGQESLTFAECSAAEEIIGRAKAALQGHSQEGLRTMLIRLWWEHNGSAPIWNEVKALIADKDGNVRHPAI